jgi:hypothetical protein
MHHGWLTPAAPGCTSSVPYEKRHSRCTNARFQERRVSARRDWNNCDRNGARPHTVGRLPNNCDNAPQMRWSPHGGLTPTALVGVRSPRGNASSFASSSSAPRWTDAGRSWSHTMAPSKRLAEVLRTNMRAPLQIRFQNYGRLTPTGPPVYVCVSCGRSWASCRRPISRMRLSGHFSR